MKKIILPGYENLVGNEVYKRGMPNNNVELVLLSRYGILSDVDLHKQIKDIIKRFKETIYGMNSGSMLMNSLENIILQLPDNIKEKLLSDDVWQVLATENSEYFDILRGIVPNRAIGYLKKPDVADEYEQAIGQQMVVNPNAAEHLMIQIKLVDHKLPDRHEMDILIKNHTYVSETLHMKGATNLLQDMACVKNLVNLVYGALKSPEHISSLADISSRQNETLAISYLMQALGKIGQQEYLNRIETCPCDTGPSGSPFGSGSFGGSSNPGKPVLH